MEGVMEVWQTPPENPAPTTFDEASMERSKSFVSALQELKNLRPQLYSAAEYCEKSYLHSEQKEMVLGNLKDYAVRAIVNAVDHLGTVAYKLSDLLEQQTLDVSTTEVKISCLNQQLLTCQTYTEKEGLRQQQLLAIIPRHHKHYILPNSLNKKVHFSPQVQTDPAQTRMQTRSRLSQSVSAASSTLSWQLASETKSTLKAGPRGSMSAEDPKTSGETSGVFQLVDAGDSTRTKATAAHLQLSGGRHASREGIQKYSAGQKDSVDGTKPMKTFRSMDNPTRRETVPSTMRSKSVLSAFFVKQKTSKMRTVS